MPAGRSWSYLAQRSRGARLLWQALATTPLWLQLRLLVLVLVLEASTAAVMVVELHQR